MNADTKRPEGIPAWEEYRDILIFILLGLTPLCVSFGAAVLASAIPDHRSTVMLTAGLIAVLSSAALGTHLRARDGEEDDILHTVGPLGLGLVCACAAMGSLQGMFITGLLVILSILSATGTLRSSPHPWRVAALIGLTLIFTSLPLGAGS